MPRRRRPGRGGAEAGPPPVSRRYELRWPSFVYIATALFLAIGAVNSQNNLLYWAFGAAVSGVVVSGLISGLALMGVRLQRDPAPVVSVGGTLTLRYRLTNVHRFMPVFALVIEEIGLGPGDGARVRMAPAVVAHCGAGSSVAAPAAGTAVRRGEVALRSVRVTSTFPFGLVRKALEFDLPDTVVVLPAVVPVRSGLADARGRGRMLDGGGTPRSGEGSEFYGIREYVWGDPLSAVAWKRSAALGSLLVRHTAVPLPPRVWVEIESAAFHSGADDFELSVTAAASLFADFATRGRAVGLSVPRAGISLTPAVGPRAVRRALVALARVEQAAPPKDPLRRPGAKDGLVRIGAGPGTKGLNAVETGSWIAPGAEVPAPVQPAVASGWPRWWRRGAAA